MKYDISSVRKIEKKVPLAIRVYLDLKDAIIKSEFAPGEFLHEEHLSQVTGASRTPIREALLHLQRDGLVEMVPRRGARILEFEPRRISELIDLQILYEAAFFDLAQRPEQHLQYYRALLDRMESLAQLMSHEIPESDQWHNLRCEYSGLGFDFHRSLVSFQSNSCILDAYDLMMGKIKMFFNCRLVKSGSFFTHSVEEHRNIIKAIIAGDFNRARTLHSNHLNRVSHCP